MANPTLSEKTFIKAAQSGEYSAPMTVQGTVNKTIILGSILVATAAATWFTVHTSFGLAGPLAIGGSILGLGLVFLLSFKPHLAPTVAPIYAVAEGAFVGAISFIFEAMYPGLVLSAVMLTFAVMAAMIGLYKAGVIKATPTLKRTVFAATAAIGLFYLVSLGLRMFGVQVPLVHDNGLFGIGFSLFVVGLAAFNLVLDLDRIEEGAQFGAPKYMEWYCAFSLMVTVVWLYIEILRLLSKISSRD